jgi:hypothetical protein
MMGNLVHRLHHWAQRPSYLVFLRALQRPEETQRAILEKLLRLARGTEWGEAHGLVPGETYERLSQRLPVTTYADVADGVERQRSTGAPVLCTPCTRYEPSSGSTRSRKWVPYSPALLAELDAAAGPWLHDIGHRHPRVLSGRHYWSLSWLPDELRRRSRGETAASSDDLDLLPWWKRRLLARVMAVPPSVAHLPTADESLHVTATELAAADDLTLVSVWSPTFALELLRRLGRNRETHAAELERRGRFDRAALLMAWDGELTVDFCVRFWPRLALISAWDTSGATSFAVELQNLFPQALFQGKGLWATEGVVTIPFQGRYPLAVNSHFYEFRCLDSQAILPSWKLRVGQEVQPLLTTGSGLWRYALDDRLQVTGHLEATPCFRFRGRLGGIDMVGEKMDDAVAQQLLDDLNAEGDFGAISLVADANGERPRYLLLARRGDPAELADRAETLLRRVHHYALARDLGQLDPLETVVEEEIIDRYYQLTGREGPAGGRKIDPLVRVK